jgi:hypothetical protein
MLALQSGRRSLARSWVVAVPVLLYATWLAWYHLTSTATTQNVVHIDNVAVIPSTIVAASSAGLSAISGLFGSTTAGAFNLDAGYLLLGLLVVAAAWRIRSGWPVPRHIWVPIALALTFWALLGMVASAHRPPTASRYLYPTAIFLLLILLDLTRGIRATPRVIAATVGALIVSLVPNLINLNNHAGKIRDAAVIERTDLAAMEMLRKEVLPADIPDLVRHARLISAGGQGFHFPATTYFNAVLRYGSPAASAQSIPARDETERQAVDGVLLQGKDLTLANAPGRSAGVRDCRRAFGPSAVGGRAFAVPITGLEIQPRGSRANLSVAARRFATTFKPLPVPAGSGPLVLRPGAMQLVRPWTVQVSGATVCARR